MKKKKISAKTLTLKLKYTDFGYHPSQTKKDEELFVGNLAQLKQRSLQKKEFVLVVNFGKS